MNMVIQVSVQASAFKSIRFGFKEWFIPHKTIIILNKIINYDHFGILIDSFHNNILIFYCGSDPLFHVSEQG